MAAWGLGSSYYNWGYASYSNPYYAEAPVVEPIVIQQTIAGGEPQTVSVPALAYDYSQPINSRRPHPPPKSPILPWRSSTRPVRRSARATTPARCASPTRR